MCKEQIQERYDLVTGRISLIAEEAVVSEPFRDFFRETARFIIKIRDFLLSKEKDAAFGDNWQKVFYADLMPGAYEKSWLDPACAVRICGTDYSDHAKALSFLAYEIRSMIPYAYEGRYEEITILSELFVEIYDIFETEIPSYEAVKNRIYWYAFDYLDVFLDRRIEEQVDPARDFAVRLIEKIDGKIQRGEDAAADLYRYGEYVSKEDLELFSFVNSLSKEEIDRIAQTYTEGYRLGFIRGKKDLSIKKTVNIRYKIGFERVVAAAIRKFRDMGLSPVIYRGNTGVLTGSSLTRIGYTGSDPNRQCSFDHSRDRALFLDKRYVSRRLDCLRQAYEKRKKLAKEMAGPAVIDFFGETPFSPVQKTEDLKLSEYQQKIAVELAAKASKIVNTYIPGEERSFTIISFPTPEIGTDFKEIFREVVRVNTLEEAMYRNVQETLIEALNQAEKVEITGRNGNKTKLTVMLQQMTDPEKQTIFENCLADVNIPVGEVFTTPELSGTNGVLHVTGVFLESLYYKDLTITFEDGIIKEAHCANFDDEEQNDRYIKENLLCDHPTLPLGEFAIGTNTTAAVMIDRYGIADRMTILIAEKTGPHFAVGDTCYSHEEDHTVYNPDGKEIIAKENTYSRLRKTDESKAYFQCHTDITIPYGELGDITAIRGDGSRILLLNQGRFVLPGTELLNSPFEEEQQGERE